MYRKGVSCSVREVGQLYGDGGGSRSTAVSAEWGGGVGQLQCQLYGVGGNRSAAVSAVGGQLQCQLGGGGGAGRSNTVSCRGGSTAVSAVGKGE